MDKNLPTGEGHPALTVAEPEAVAVVVIGWAGAVLGEAVNHESTDVEVGRDGCEEAKGEEAKAKGKRGGYLHNYSRK